MTNTVYCLATNGFQADQIVRALHADGFGTNDISVLFPDRKGTKDFAHEMHTKAPEGATVGAGTGGLLGGALGWIVGIGALAIPGAGPFIAAGPILAALSGAAVGATVGGLTGALIGMGIPEIEAKRYEGKIRDGRILISTHVDNADETKRTKDIYTRLGAEDIATGSEASVHAPTGGAGLNKN